MPAILSKCDPEVREIVDALIDDHYPDLKDAGVRITLLFASAERNEHGDPKGPALKLHGYPCAATVKVNSYADRVEGKGDCTIKIDGDEWPVTPDDRRRALLDHELYHIVVRRQSRTKGGGVATDDLGRPLLKLRLHDLVVGGFKEIIARHRDAAVESDHVRHCVDQTGQYLMFEHEHAADAA